MTYIKPHSQKYEMIDISKSCSNCKHSENVRINSGLAQWFCHMTPFNHIDLEGEYRDFEMFYCSSWKNVFEKEEK